MKDECNLDGWIISKVAGKVTSKLYLRRDCLNVQIIFECPPIWKSGMLLRIPWIRLEFKNGRWRALAQLKVPEGKWTVYDTFDWKGNTLIVKREWKWEGSPLGNIRMGLDVLVLFQRLDFWAMPYISMNGNRTSCEVPVGMSKCGEPYIFREERMTAPALMTLESAGFVVGTYTEPGHDEQTISACCIEKLKRKYRLRTFFPHYESPATFLGIVFQQNGMIKNSHGVYSNSSHSRGFYVCDKFTIQRCFYIVIDKVASKRHGYFNVWESAWNNMKEESPPPISFSKMEKVLWKAIDYHWIKHGGVVGYATRIDRNGNAYTSLTPTLAVAWCSPTMMLAWLALRRAMKLRNRAEAELPLRAAQFFIEKGDMGNGLFRTHFDLSSGKWIDKNCSAVQLGGAVYWILRCVRLLNHESMFKNDTLFDRDEWMRFALKFCELAVRTQLPNGAFPSGWEFDGKSIEPERAMGVHTARAVLEAYSLTLQRIYLKSAEIAAQYYIKNCVEHEVGYGDCNDVLSTTNENDAAGLADLLIELYRITGKREYLNSAIRSSEYCLSFMFTYNVYFPSETDCGRRGMKTRGCSAISPETACVCPFFTLQANTFIELYKLTGEQRWKDYAVTMIRGSLQMMTEKNDTFGLAPHLIGCRAEILPVLDMIKGAFIWKKGMTEYAMHEPVWWPAVFNLLNFAVIEDVCPELLKELN